MAVLVGGWDGQGGYMVRDDLVCGADVGLLQLCRPDGGIVGWDWGGGGNNIVEMGFVPRFISGS